MWHTLGGCMRQDMTGIPSPAEMQILQGPLGALLVPHPLESEDDLPGAPRNITVDGVKSMNPQRNRENMGKQFKMVSTP